MWIKWEDCSKYLLQVFQTLKVFATHNCTLSYYLGESFIGDLQIRSINARLMVRLSVLSAWAKLQIQITQQEYLINIVAPHVGTLIPMWLEVLSAYAKLQFEPGVGDGAVVDDLLVDNRYSFASKEFLLQVTILFLGPQLTYRSTIPAGFKS